MSYGVNPLLVGILVYNEDMSIVTSIALRLTFLVDSTLRRKATVSFTKDGSCSASGFRWWSTKRARFVVGLLMAAIIGLPGFFGLWTLGKV